MWYFILLSLFTVPRHDFHVSVALAEVKPGRVEVTAKLFTDDLERALEQKHSLSIRLGWEDEHPATDSLLAVYLEEHLQITPSKSRQFIGKEVENELTYIYVEFFTEEAPAELEIRNRLLFDLFEDQRNLFNLKKGDLSRSAYFSPDEPIKTIKLYE